MTETTPETTPEATETPTAEVAIPETEPSDRVTFTLASEPVVTVYIDRDVNGFLIAVIEPHDPTLRVSLGGAA